MLMEYKNGKDEEGGKERSAAAEAVEGFSGEQWFPW